MIGTIWSLKPRTVDISGLSWLAVDITCKVLFAIASLL